MISKDNGFPNPYKGEYLVYVRSITYNHRDYIVECMDGVAKQETTFPFVQMVIDDASPDGAQAVIKDYVNREFDLDNAIYYDNDLADVIVAKHKKNKNYTIAAYLLKQNMYGNPKKEDLYKPWRDVCKYEAICEGDDYWTDSSKLQQQIDFLEANPEFSASAHQSMYIGAMEGLFMENVPSVISMNDIVSNSRLFHTSSFIIRTDKFFQLPPMSLPYISGDKLSNLKATVCGPIKYFDEPWCVYRIHTTGMSKVVKLKDLKKDLNIATYMTSIYPTFPKYRFLSFLYGTFAMYPTDVTIINKVFYLFLSFILSFSYFPSNIGDVILKIRRSYHLKHQ